MNRNQIIGNLLNEQDSDLALSQFDKIEPHGLGAQCLVPMPGQQIVDVIEF